MWDEAIRALDAAGVDVESFANALQLGGSPPALLKQYGLTALQVLEVLGDPAVRKFVDEAQGLLKYHVLSRLYRSALESEDVRAATRLLAALVVTREGGAPAAGVSAGEREWMLERLDALFATEQGGADGTGSELAAGGA